MPPHPNVPAKNPLYLKYKDTFKTYYEKNKEKLLAKQKEYYKKNKQRMIDQVKQHYRKYTNQYKQYYRNKKQKAYDDIIAKKREQLLQSSS